MEAADQNDNGYREGGAGWEYKQKGRTGQGRTQVKAESRARQDTERQFSPTI